MSPARTAPLLVAAGAAVVLAGCSGPTAEGAATPQAAVTTFFHALGGKDSAGACAVISTGGRPLNGVPLQQCALGFDKVLAGLGDQQDITALAGATVTGATVTGDRATVTRAQITKVPEGFQNDIDLVRVEGRWYIDSKADPTDTGSPTDGATG